MKVYMLKTHEKMSVSLMDQYESEGNPMPALYTTRELAEAAAKDYNEQYHDEIPATAIEVEVAGCATTGRRG